MPNPFVVPRFIGAGQRNLLIDRMNAVTTNGLGECLPSEGRKPLPGLRFGLVWWLAQKPTNLAVGSIFRSFGIFRRPARNLIRNSLMTSIVNQISSIMAGEPRV